MTKKEFDSKLQKFNLTKKDLSLILKIPYGTINNWNGDNKPFPDWLEVFFYYYEKSKNFDSFLEIINKYKI